MIDTSTPIQSSNKEAALLRPDLLSGELVRLRAIFERDEALVRKWCRLPDSSWSGSLRRSGLRATVSRTLAFVLRPRQTLYKVLTEEALPSGLMIEGQAGEVIGMFRIESLNIRHKHAYVRLEPAQLNGQSALHSLIVGCIYLVSVYDLRKVYLEVGESELIGKLDQIEEISRIEGVLHRIEKDGEPADLTIRAIDAKKLLNYASEHAFEIWGRDVEIRVQASRGEQRGYATGYDYFGEKGQRVLGAARRHVRLEPTSETYASLAFQWLTTPSRADISPHETPYQLLNEAQFKLMVTSMAGSDFTLVAVREHDQRPIGFLTAQETNQGYVHAGMIMDPMFRFSPYAAYSFALFLEYLAGHKQIRKIYLETSSANLPALRPLLEIATVEAVLQDHLQYGGRSWDQYVLAIDSAVALKAMGDSEHHASIASADQETFE